MIKVSVQIAIQITLYEIIKRMSQTSQRMTDLKNYKLVLKIFIRGSSTESKEEHPCHWGFINKKCQWKGCVSW